jgi:hypothetical protein
LRKASRFLSYLPSTLTRIAAEHAKSDPRGENGNKVFTVPELEWFRKNAYNVGVTKCHV